MAHLSCKYRAGRTLLASSCLALLLPMALAAQDEGFRNFGSADFERFLTQDLRKEFDKQLRNFGASYRIKPENTYTASFHANKQLVLFYATYPVAERISLEKINDWNVKAFYSRAYLLNDAPRRLVFEGTLPFAAGVTRQQALSFFDRLDNERLDFERFIGAGVRPFPGGKNDPVAFAKNEETVHFPLGASAAEAQSSWKVRYVVDRVHGLRIKGAWFRRPGENPEWLKVVDDLHVSDLYVPYQDNVNRFFDMDMRLLPKHGPWKLNQLPLGSENLLGPHAKFVDDGYTVREDRDAGLLWLYSDQIYTMSGQRPEDPPRTGKTFAMRRQEMQLWGVFQGTNYFYVMQYSFQNDGSIIGRLGSTGKNYHKHNRVGTGHMHNTLWRVQLDLGGSGPDEPVQFARKNSVSLVSLQESKGGLGRANSVTEPLLQEGSWLWKAEEFTALRIESSGAKNRLGNAAVYDFVPLRYGSARHFAPARLGQPKNAANHMVPGDDFTHADFWVTNDDPAYTDYRELPKYTFARKPLLDRPVIWHISSNLHTPRDEDFRGLANLKGERDQGCASVMFSGFELRPRSVLRDTPFIAPAKAGMENHLK